MKIGVCGNPELMEQAKAAGFDYIELPMSGIASLSEEAFVEVQHKAQELDLPSPAFNLLFPGTLQLMTCADTEIAAYLEKAFARAQKLGCKIAVFGSGRARAIPEGMSFADGFRRLVQVTRLTGEIAARYGITIAIEPLNRRETNIINSVAEGGCLAAAVDLPSVQVLADYYHIAEDNEPLTDIARVGALTHTHMALKGTRGYPVAKDAGVAAFMGKLKAIGYTGHMSVEGNTTQFDTDAPLAIQTLKKLWADA